MQKTHKKFIFVRFFVFLVIQFKIIVYICLLFDISRKHISIILWKKSII